MANDKQRIVTVFRRVRGPSQPGCGPHRISVTRYLTPITTSLTTMPDHTFFFANKIRESRILKSRPFREKYSRKFFAKKIREANFGVRGRSQGGGAVGALLFLQAEAPQAPSNQVKVSAKGAQPSTITNEN